MQHYTNSRLIMQLSPLAETPRVFAHVLPGFNWRQCLGNGSDGGMLARMAGLWRPAITQRAVNTRRAINRVNEMCCVLSVPVPAEFARLEPGEATPARGAARARRGRMLDYGSGSRVIVSACARAVAMHAYTCDTPALWLRGADSDDTVHDVLYRDTTSGIVPFEGQFELITCFMSLHRVPIRQLEAVLDMIVSRLEPGGKLVVREHDARTTRDRDLIHLECALHACVRHHVSFAEFQARYCGNYQSMTWWIEQFTRRGLQLVGRCDPSGVTRFAYVAFTRVLLHSPEHMSARGADQSEAWQGDLAAPQRLHTLGA